MSCLKNRPTVHKKPKTTAWPKQTKIKRNSQGAEVRHRNPSPPLYLLTVLDTDSVRKEVKNSTPSSFTTIKVLQNRITQCLKGGNVIFPSKKPPILRRMTQFTQSKIDCSFEVQGTVPQALREEREEGLWALEWRLLCCPWRVPRWSREKCEEKGEAEELFWTDHNPLYPASGTSEDA